MGRVVCTLDPAVAAARDAAMLARLEAGGAAIPGMSPAPLSNGCVLSGSRGAGELFPQPVSGASDERLRLDDILEKGAWLISRVPTSIGLPGVAVYDLSDPLIAPFQTQLHDWLDSHEASAVLVRPDRYVFGGGEPQVLAEAWRAILKPHRIAA
jgi:3-(3-hydroxy-phenyl)propionate hydroxylase